MQFPSPSRPRSTTRCSTAGPTGSRPATTTRSSPTAGTPWRPGSPVPWLEDPPAADGRKVVISDTDHYAPGTGDALWAWKSFLRGHHPILMDFGIIGGVNPLDPSAGRSLEPSSRPLRDGRHPRFAERMNLIEMEPRGDLSSTGYALANPGQEYLVLQPSDGRAVHRDAGAGHLRGRVVRHRGSQDGPRRRDDRRALGGHQLPPPPELSGPRFCT